MYWETVYILLVMSHIRISELRSQPSDKEEDVSNFENRIIKLAISEEPDCTSRNGSLSCCLIVTYDDLDSPICVELRMANSTPTAGFSISGKEMFRTNITIGELCPEDVPIRTCLDVYLIQYSPDGSTEYCLSVKFYTSFKLDYGCFRLHQRAFTKSNATSIKPETISGTSFVNGLKGNFLEFEDFSENK